MKTFSRQALPYLLSVVFALPWFLGFGSHQVHVNGDYGLFSLTLL